jgi:uncharacterized membrane protein
MITFLGRWKYTITLTLLVIFILAVLVAEGHWLRALLALIALILVVLSAWRKTRGQ